MSCILLLAATAAMGIEVGWQPLATGGHEYTIQLEPAMLRVLEEGKEDLFSEVPPGIEIRRYRITVGSGALPRDAGSPPPAEPPVEPNPVIPDPPADDVGPQVNVGPPPADDDIPPAQGNDATFAQEPPAENPPPAKLPPEAGDANPIKHAKFNGEAAKGAGASSEQTTEKPELTEGVGKPWGVLLGSVALLCCSLGGNIYLGWIAWEARNRYRDAVCKFRAEVA